MNYHIEIRIERALTMSDTMLKSMFGLPLEQTRKDLEDRKQKGELMIGSAECEGFDPMTGCPGHND